ncbi:cytidine deaminase [Biostraticola tofi]|uniref:Cytidine deaminase n=1 Tax=Biostraticola tofi TaxID=466109 RepID=A0A4R3Z4W5_9GAMM|nr:cytidine deaminase [Biostraticola tofi]TCW00233.1 cytidine deaminase [Biostraticola tofi]
MQSRFTLPLSALDPALKTALTPLLASPDFAGVIDAEQVSRLLQATGLEVDRLCFALLPVAAACALAPISRFTVGAVAHGVSGTLYLGANMEFIGAPLAQTVHAEQSAISHAWLCGESRLAGITVNYTPCGHCRQFMNELNSGTDLRISLPGRASQTLGHYLPDAFGPRDLAIDALLLDEVHHDYRIGPAEGARCATPGDVVPRRQVTSAAAAEAAGPASLPAGDPLSQLALAAMNRSHAPYSQAHSGMALELVDGRIFAGRYAENAAFNPSLPPLQSALIMMNLAGGQTGEIRRAVLAERENAAFSQWDATRATLAALGVKQCYRLGVVD